MTQFEISTRVGCKNMCSYCPQKKIIKAYKSNKYIMDFRTFKICVDKIPKNIKMVFAGMAEPFLNKDCTKMILYAKKKGHDIEIFTTGVGITEKDVKELEKIHIKYFDFHLPDKDGDTQIKVDAVFLRAVKLLKESKIKIHYQVFGELHPEVKKVLDFDVEDLSRLLQNRAGNIEEGFNFKPKRIKGKIICLSADKRFDNNVLLPNGDVYLCCMDYGLKHKLGNLLESSYENLFNTDYFKQLQKALDDDSKEILCRYCSYARKTNSLRYNSRKVLDKLHLTNKFYNLIKYKPIKNIYNFVNKKIK